MKTTMPLLAAIALATSAPAATWYVNPAAGDDGNAGTSSGIAWKSLAKVNATKLAPGDSVVIAPGRHGASLVPMATGTAEQPVVIRFLPGVHEFVKEQAIRRAYYISNSCGAPEQPIPISILLENCSHLVLQGGGVSGAGRTTLMMDGRMTHFVNDRSEDIRYEGLVFDLKRPTVSEFRVLESEPGSSLVQIAEGSTYQVTDGTFSWTGDIGSGDEMTQEAIPEEGRAWRAGVNRSPLSKATSVEDLGGGKLRLNFDGNFQLKAGHQFQFRYLGREVVGAHQTRCKDMVFRDCDFNALTGMGIVSQFTDGITFERVRIIPPEGTLRTCPAWADGFHFSGCRGKILVADCVFSGMQDDPINVHGTHLGITGKPAANKLALRFMHKQTYGFAPFQPGDEVAVIAGRTLREIDANPRRKVTDIRRISETDWEITLDGPAPAFEPGDVLDNITWYPDVTISGCKIDMDSCRGFLLTTRGKVLVEGNTFHRCRMPAILVEGDADGWHESGPIRDMVIRNNNFIGCGISINPRVRIGDEPVHDNIRITGNVFREGAGISAHHAARLTITGNTSPDGEIPIKLAPNCTEVTVEHEE
jgi:hypothetical protein